MKHLLFMIVLAVGVSFGQAQEAKPLEKFDYCEITILQKMMSKKVTISMDFGQKQKLMEDLRLKGDDGKPIIFNTKIDALNHMGEDGWELVSTTYVSSGTIVTEKCLMKKRRVGDK